MLKDVGYQEKFVMLKMWMTEMVDVVKKDLKNEHLKIDRGFCKRYFLGKNINQIQVQEMAEAYAKDIHEGNSGLGEFIATRWLLKNTDIYGYFEAALKNMTSDFESLEEMPFDFSKQLMESAAKKFGAKRTYLFCVLNSVVFPKAIYDVLSQAAIAETQKEVKSVEESEDVQAVKKRYEKEYQQLKERFENKFSGLERKYLNDMESLKKQIRNLQKKLESVGKA